MQILKNQSRKINRTVCIGLGGTGRDVLMRIRRLIVDRYGNLTQLPVVSFVHIDTDNGASNGTGLKTGNNYRGVDLRFSNVEKVTATMNQFEVDNLVKELSVNLVNYNGNFRDSRQYESETYFLSKSISSSHIASWFPPPLLKDVKAIEQGAKGIRPVGRLAFFHNYQKIKKAIALAETKTRGQEAFMMRKNWHLDPKLNIFVVGSLCGGTGSGMFLDVAYCLRQMYGNDGAQITGYFAICPELYGNSPSKIANTYAALKELNYYATAGTVFKADYDLHTLDSVAESRPPFDYIYLVSHKTAKDYQILEKSKLCNIIARKITLDFAGELAYFLEEQRDNFEEPMMQTDEHPRPNVQRYLTFGLAQIYFPRDITIRISLNRIKVKLIDFWLCGEGQSADPLNLLKSFLDSWKYNLENSNIFTTKLQQTTINKDKTFDCTLRTWIDTVENKIVEIQNSNVARGEPSCDRIQKIISLLSREIRSEFRKVQPGKNNNSRGLWLTGLQQQQERITAEYIKDIDNYLAQLLDPNSIDFSLTNARAWLEALTTELNTSYREIEDCIDTTRLVHSLEIVEIKWQNSKQTIQDIGRQKELFLFKKRRNREVLEEAQKIVREVSQLAKDNYEVSLFREALTMVKTLRDHVNQLTRDCSNFNNILNNVKLKYQQTEEDFKLQDMEKISGEAIFSDSDTDDCYRSLLPDRDRLTQLALVSSKITHKVGLGTESLASCLERGVIDEYGLQSEINFVVDTEFGSRSLSKVQSVAKRFLESYSLSDRSVRIEQIIRESEPLLALDLADPYFYPDRGKTLKIIGFKDTDKPEITQLKDILSRDLGIQDSNLKPIQAEDEIIFVNEYAGFPLRLIRGLMKMREHYLRHKSNGNFLHNDYRTQFVDPIPPDGWEMKRLQDIFYPAVAFELLPFNSRIKKYEFQYHDELRDIYEVATFSHVWDEALEKLASIEGIVTALDKKLQAAISDLTQNPHQWNNHYLPKLRQFVTTVDNLPQSDPNYLYRETVVGNSSSMIRQQQHGIINRFWQKMITEIEQEMIRQQEKRSPISSPNISHNMELPEAITSDIDPKIQQLNNDSIIDAEFSS